MSTDTAVNRAAVHAQALAMLGVLDHMMPGRRDDLARDPIAVLRDWPDVVYREVPPADTDSRCSVAGAYYGTENPPLLTVADATSPGRRAFSGLHELGHHLQQSDLDLANTVDEHGDNRERFEDAACDAFAAELLLPVDLVTRHLPGGTPTADHVISLYRDSAASRAAVCVRAAQHLAAPGHVLLLNESGIVQFASSYLLPRPARDSDQSAAAVIARALTSPTGRGRASGRLRLRYRDDIEGDELYAQAAPMDGYLIVVAVTDHAPWESGFTLPIAQTGPRGRWRICVHPECGHEFQSFEAACPRCETPSCPECGRCECARAMKEKQCPVCFTVYPQSYFDGDRCRDCA
jgi:hypothetical protein